MKTSKKQIEKTNEVNYTTSKATYSGAYRTQFANFEDGTFAKLVTIEKQTLKGKFSNLVSIDGTYDRSKLCVTMSSLGFFEITKLSNETAEISEILNHSFFGLCKVFDKNEKCMSIEVLSTNEKKSVFTAIFMNNVKK